MKKLPVSCNKDCGGGCPLIAHIEDGRLQRITNNPLKNPYMTGCVRGYQMPKVVYAHDRLTSPLVRTGKRGSGKFSEISWEEGLDPATLQHSNLIILWGANIVDNRFGCEMESRIREARPTAIPVISNSFIPRDATSCPREATCTRTSGPFRKPNSPYATTTS